MPFRPAHPDKAIGLQQRAERRQLGLHVGAFGYKDMRSLFAGGRHFLFGQQPTVLKYLVTNAIGHRIEPRAHTGFSDSFLPEWRAGIA